ncbi:MAG TPA: NTP transferase domain-containing protein [Pirellulaceae bacterium]|nr:NTP transferase domain-containing protein [Pirellulaceae bacterium]HMO92793.1 NTP transferase domain-containing protein [Pirellulaceae bacterium]HMP69375.1 NTP transferase domain-containing protein [Pirellulaceae bacterium]
MNRGNSPIAVVLAAGKGTRMKSDLPKVLCEANSRPLVEYVLKTLKNAGVERIIVVVGYRSDLVRERLSHWPGIEFAEQTEQLGTGHAVAVCKELLHDHDGPIIVVAGDSPMLQVASIRSLLDNFNAEPAGAVMGTLIHDNPIGLGRIVRDTSGNFEAIVEEKDATDEQRLIREVNMSTYVFDCRQLLNALNELRNDNRQNEYYITDVPGIMLRHGSSVRALPVLQQLEALSVNTVDELKEVERALNRGQAANA